MHVSTTGTGAPTPACLYIKRPLCGNAGTRGRGGWGGGVGVGPHLTGGTLVPATGKHLTHAKAALWPHENKLHYQPYGTQERNQKRTKIAPQT